MENRIKGISQLLLDANALMTLGSKVNIICRKKLILDVKAKLLHMKEILKDLPSIEISLSANSFLNVQWIDVVSLSVYSTLQSGLCTPRKADYNQSIHELALDVSHLIVCQLGNIEQRTPVRVRCLNALIECCMKVMPNNSVNDVKGISEECKMLAIKIVKEIYQLKEFIRTDENLVPIHGLLISSLLDIPKCERSKALKVFSLTTLITVISKIQDPDIIGFLMPGILSNLFHFLREEYKSDSKFHQLCLKCFLCVIRVTLDDCRTVELQEINHYNVSELYEINASERSEDPVEGAEMMLAGKSFRRDTKWLKQAQDKILHIFDQILLSLTKHSSWKVRLELSHLCGFIIERCRKSLTSCFYPCINGCFILSHDEISDVSTASVTYLSRLFHSDSTLMLVVEDRILNSFLSFTTQLSDVCSKAINDSEALYIMYLLRGYLELFQDRLSNFLNTNFDNLCDIWGQKILVLDHNQILGKTYERRLAKQEVDDVQNITCLKGMGTYIIIKPQFMLKYITSDKGLQEIQRILALMGQYTQTDIYFTIIFDRVEDPDNIGFRANYLLLLRDLLQGLKVNKSSFENISFMHQNADSSPPDNEICENNKAVIKDVIKTIIRDDLWCLSYPNSANKKKYNDQVRDSECIACLFMEIISICIEILSEASQDVLMDIIFLVVEKLGHPNIYVKDCAVNCLNLLCMVTNCKSIEVLLLQNMDYIVDMLNYRFRFLDIYNNTPEIMEAIFEALPVTSIQNVPFVLNDTMTNMFNFLDQNMHNEEQISKFLSVIHTIVKFTAKDLKMKLISEPTLAKVAKQKRNQNSCIDSLLAEIQDFEQHREIELFSTVENTLPDNVESIIHSNNVDGAMPIENSPNQAELFGTSDGTTEILIEAIQRSEYFLYTHNKKLKRLAFNILRDGLQILKSDKSRFLPLVHRIWVPLVSNISDESYHTNVAIIEILTLLIDLCGEFIGDRIQNEIWPIIKKFLIRTQRTESPLFQPWQSCCIGPETSDLLRESEERTYYSKNDQLLLKWIEFLIKACTRIEVLRFLVWDIGNIILPFISHFDSRIRYSTFDLFHTLYHVNSHQIFVILSCAAQELSETWFGKEKKFPVNYFYMENNTQLRLNKNLESHASKALQKLLERERSV